MEFLIYAWYVIYMIQVFLGYGSAYRATKNGGDNGIALFGWLIVYTIAAWIPFLGYYLWKQSKKENELQF